MPIEGHAGLLPLAVFITFAAAQTSASTPAPTSLGSKTPDPASLTQSVNIRTRWIFPVGGDATN